jgi:hypothetical protein
MIRGTQSVLSLFPTSIDTKTEQKGHRNVHIDRRDEVLTTRFYYYYQIRRMRYDDALVELETEFFITPNVILQRIGLKGDLMKQLVKNETKVTTLRKKYPFFNWAA